jgi:hypothetical protein
MTDYSSVYMEEIEKGFGVPWPEELARIRSHVLLPFEEALTKIRRSQFSEAMVFQAFASLVRAWQAFPKESVPEVDQGGRTGT